MQASAIIISLIIWTPAGSPLIPRWADQFEFDAGDVFRAYTTTKAELSGTWIETPLGSSSWFQAYVEKSEESTTTTTTPANTTTTIPSFRSPSGSLSTSQKVKYDINLWGLSFLNSCLILPFDAFGYSVIIGYGNYLGANATFLGFAAVPGPGKTPSFGGISPNEGEQEQTYTDVTITGVNTKFQDEPPVNHYFHSK